MPTAVGHLPHTEHVHADPDWHPTGGRKRVQSAGRPQCGLQFFPILRAVRQVPEDGPGTDHRLSL